MTYNDKTFKTWKRQKKIEDNIIKDVKNLFRLKRKQLILQLKMYEIVLG